MKQFCRVLGVVAGLASTAEALTLRTETERIQFPTSMMSAVGNLFGYQTQSGGIAGDRSNNVHILHTAQPGHLGHARYRRLNAPTQALSATVNLKCAGDTANDNYFSGLLAIDGADRVHAIYLYQYISGTAAWYHAWCTNASGAAPLALGNWQAPAPFTLLPAITSASSGTGSLVAMGSNRLALAYCAELTGDALTDIGVWMGEWDGTGWVWGSNAVLVAPSTLNANNCPTLLYAPSNDVLHLVFYQPSVNGSRVMAHAYSLNPGPTNTNWTASVRFTAINPALSHNENFGSAGLEPDGSVRLLLAAFGNRDNNLANMANYTRRWTLESGWGAWIPVFPGDARLLPASYFYTLQYSGPWGGYAPDGAGGLFAYCSTATVMHWDPVSGTWADVFTGLTPRSINPAPTIVTEPRPHPLPSRVHVYDRAGQTLYTGEYLIRPADAGGALLLIR